jgi:hypothetical protein
MVAFRHIPLLLFQKRTIEHILKNFAPFVNTVQQTLLEKSLCLIGFSGDDPNFLQWIGWIRDNFPETTPLKNIPCWYYKSIGGSKKITRSKACKYC